MQVHQASSTSSQWLWYVNGIKKVLDAVCPARQHTVRNEEKTALLRWAHYHDVLARFSLRHWAGTGADLPPRPSTNAEAHGSRNLPVTLLESASHFERGSETAILRILEILREVCDVVAVLPRVADMTVDERDEYRGYLQVLDWRLRSVNCNEYVYSAELTEVVRLYRLAVLVYLHRATGDVLGFTRMTQKYLDEAFAIFPRLEACERQFPVFILGAEARSDEERAVVLDLVSRTEDHRSSRSLAQVKVLLNAVWTQDDLAGGTLDYRDKMTGVISSSAIVPSLV